ncbi:NAD(P)-binding domain containing protein [Trema orientale]|uniref:NAD(P)-binding domain containing protein n=1 Tax=Trema orientale TaxID=63057 RepID=A0A2P5EYA5_TREOI|nr:NAD(P)-binding domain containing protein [Trema orientale]
MVEKERVCVTGAGGYVASWVVKFLLSQGYMVHGTVRDPSDQKNAHLKKLEKADENLQLFKTDLLDYDGLCAAIAGCSGVFHIACPVFPGKVPNPETQLIEPAVTGTRNVLNACVKAGVKRVVLVSSIAAIMYNPKWPKDKSMDEECWSDQGFCKETENFYSLGKTIAEAEAWEFAKSRGLSVVSVCPSIVIGPMLQSTVNASSLLLLFPLREGLESLENNARAVVDVRDLAEALLLTYKNPEAEGRYICSSYIVRMKVLVDMLKSKFPNFNYPKSITEVNDDVNLSSEKLQKLGWKYRPLEDTLVDSVKSYEEIGILSKDRASV